MVFNAKLVDAVENATRMIGYSRRGPGRLQP